MINFEKIETIKKQDGWEDVVKYLISESDKELKMAIKEGQDQLEVIRHLAKYKKLDELISFFTSNRA